MASISAVLDACVLFPAPLRDALLRSAQHGLYQLFWTEEILEETRRSLVSTGRTSEEQAASLILTMRRAFPDSAVDGYQPLIDRMTNHEGDRHVLAAAVAAGAAAIVTNNLRHFHPAALRPYNITAQSPDEFLLNLIDSDPERVKQVIREQAAALRSPPMSVEAVLAKIARDAPDFARRMVDLLSAG